jgi:hypothetical protein
LVKNALAETSVGLAARATGVVDYEPQDIGTAGNLVAGLGSFVLDPATYAGMGLGGWVVKGLMKTMGKEAAEQVVTYAAKRGLGPFAARAAQAAIVPSATLGTVTAARDPLEQYIETGEVDIGQTATRTAQSAAVGAMLGPASQAGRLAIPAEIGTFALGQPLVEGRAPTGEDVVGSMGAVIGMRAAGVVVRLSRSAKDRLLEDYHGRQAAGQKDPMPNADTFREADPELGEVPRKDRAVILDFLEKEKADEVRGARGPEAAVRPEGVEAQPQPQEGQAQAPQAEGAAVLEGASGRSPTSIKNAVVDQERALRGLPPAMQPARRSFGAVWDEAIKLVDDNPMRQDSLIRELKENPKAIGDLDDALLLHRQVSLQNEYDKVLDRLTVARRANDDAAIAEASSAEQLVGNQLLELYDINKAVGSATSRGLNARKMLANEDFTLAKMSAQKRAAEGVGELSKESREKVTASYQRIKELETKLAEHVQRIDTMKAEKAATDELAKLSTGVTNKQSARRKQAEAELEEAWKDFTLKAAGTLYANPIEALPSAVRLAKAYVKLGVIKFEDFIARVAKKIGDDKAEKARPALQEAWTTAIAEEKPQPKKAVETNRELSKFAKELAEYFVERGVRTRDELVDAVHVELKSIVPQLTRRQAMDAISGYGDYSPLSKDELKVALRDLKGQMQQVAKLEDMQAGQAPLKTGPERRTPSDEERRLIQQVNEAKKLGGFSVTDPETQLRTSLDTIKTRFRHQIADLAEQIAKGQKIVKKRAVVPLDIEAKRLKERRDSLKKDFDEIFGKPDLTDAQRVSMATKSLERSITEYERRIEARDIGPRLKVFKTPVTPELEALRARRDALKDDLQHLKDLANPKMTPEERSLSAYKAATKNRIADYQERLARGDFTPKAKKSVVFDAEAEQLRFEAEKTKTDFMRGLEADRRKNRTIVQKIFGVVPESLNTARAIVTSFDYSAVLRQGGFLTFGHPIRSAKILGTMFRAGWSEAGEFRAMQEITNRPNAALYKRAKLELTGIHGRLSAMEEAYMSHWAKKIPLVAGSERAYVAFLNRLRADSFDALVSTLSRNRRLTDADAKVIANFVNVATGRGNLGRFQAAAVPLATVFFSPRYVTSRFQLHALQPLYRGGLSIKAAIAKEYARTLIGVGVFYSLSNMALEALLGEPHKNTWGITLDPRSSDFAKLRIGRVRIDPLFGLQQATVVLSRLVSGETKTLRGKVQPIRGRKVPFGGTESVDVLARFMRSKLSPALGSMVNLAAGENMMGERFGPEDVPAELLVPLGVRDIYEAMVEAGLPGGAAFGLLSLFGMSIQTYEKKVKRRAA